MNTKQIMNLLNNIVTNDVENQNGVQKELSFRLEPNADNNALYDSSMLRDYSVEEVASLISLMDVQELTDSDKELLEILHRRLESDNINGDMFVNEEMLIGPLAQKIMEYEHVVENKEFNTNLSTLNDLKARNQNFSNVSMHSYKETETDSKYKLDYISIKKDDGVVEVLPITDPDYLDRFKDEHANAIGSMTSEEFYNKLKASTENELQFVDLNQYMTNPDIRNRMHSPRVQDEQLLGYERDEVQRLVEKFIPGTKIEIAIDSNGEVFYRAGDALYKGFDKEDHRDVRTIRESSKIKNYIDDKAINMTNEEVEKQIEVEQNNDTVDNTPDTYNNNAISENVVLDPERFFLLMDAADPILNGDDLDSKTELLNQINAAVKERSEETIGDAVQKKVSEYYLWRKTDLELMRRDGRTTSGVPMTSREIAILEEIEEKDRLLNGEVRDQGSEIDNYDYTNEQEELEQNFDTPAVEPSVGPQGKVRRLGNSKKAHYGLTGVVVLIEILTVALIVMMFLSLDI